MCRWSRYYFTECGHPEAILLDFCEHAQYLPAFYAQQVLGIVKERKGMEGLQPPIALCTPDSKKDSNSRQTIGRRYTRESKGSTSSQLTHFEGVGHNDSVPTEQSRPQIDRDTSLDISHAVPGANNSVVMSTANKLTTMTTVECDALIRDLEAVKRRILLRKEQAQDEEQGLDTQLNEQVGKLPGEQHSHIQHLKRARSRLSVNHAIDNPVVLAPRKPSYADILKSRAEITESHSGNDLPRFAQPTAATTRRQDETLRRQTLTSAATTAEVSPVKAIVGRAASTSPLKRTPSRLPKRNGLPDSWTTGEIAKDIIDTTPSSDSDRQYFTPKTSSPVRSKMPAYQLPTKSTIQRELETFRPVSAGKSPKIKTGSKATSEASLHAMGVAIAQVSQASRQLAAVTGVATRDHTIQNTRPSRRESNANILAPILVKLEQQGLLRDGALDIESDMPARPSRSSYADILRGASDRTPQDLVVPNQTISDALDDAHTAAAHIRRLDTTSENNSRIVIPSGSSYTYDEGTKWPITRLVDHTPTRTSTRAHAGSHPEKDVASVGTKESTSPVTTDDSIEINPYAAASPTKMNQTKIWAWNVDASPFEPKVSGEQHTTGTPGDPELPPSSNVEDDDIFKIIPESQWNAMPSAERVRLHAKRKHELMRLFTPLTYQKNTALPVSGISKSGSTWPRAWNGSSDDSSSQWSPAYPVSKPGRPRQGWKIDAATEAALHWSVGGGREIRFTGDALRAERQEEDTYCYVNRETGRRTYLDNDHLPPARTDDHDRIDRLQAAMRRGYPKVPCDNYTYDQWRFNVIPGCCPYCRLS